MAVSREVLEALEKKRKQYLTVKAANNEYAQAYTAAKAQAQKEAEEAQRRAALKAAAPSVSEFDQFNNYANRERVQASAKTPAPAKSEFEQYLDYAVQKNQQDIASRTTQNYRDPKVREQNARQMPINQRMTENPLAKKESVPAKTPDPVKSEFEQYLDYAAEVNKSENPIRSTEGYRVNRNNGTTAVGQQLNHGYKGLTYNPIEETKKTMERAHPGQLKGDGSYNDYQLFLQLRNNPALKPMLDARVAGGKERLEKEGRTWVESTGKAMYDIAQPQMGTRDESVLDTKLRNAAPADGWTEDEKAYIAYVYATHDTKTADKILQRVINPTHNQKWMEGEIDKGGARGAVLQNVVAPVANVGSNLVQGVYGAEVIGQNIKNTVTGKDETIPDYSVGSALARANKNSAELFTRGDSEGVAFAKNLGLSIADNVANLVIYQGAAPAMMAVSAGSGSAYEAGQRGATTGQQLATGVTSGLLEYFTEKISFKGLENIFKGTSKSTVKNVAKQIAKQVFTEGSEEMVNEAGQILADAIIMSENWGTGSQSDYDKFLKEYLESNPATANDQAMAAFVLESLKEIGLAGLSGGISGGVMGSGATVIGNTKSTLQTGKKYNDPKSVKALIASGLESPKDSKSYKLAEKASKKEKALSNYEVGRLVRANASQIAQEESAQQKAAATPQTNPAEGTSAQNVPVNVLADGGQAQLEGLANPVTTGLRPTRTAVQTAMEPGTVPSTNTAGQQAATPAQTMPANATDTPATSTTAEETPAVPRFQSNKAETVYHSRESNLVRTVRTQMGIRSRTSLLNELVETIKNPDAGRSTDAIFADLSHYSQNTLSVEDVAYFSQRLAELHNVWETEQAARQAANEKGEKYKPNGQSYWQQLIQFQTELREKLGETDTGLRNLLQELTQTVTNQENGRSADAILADLARKYATTAVGEDTITAIKSELEKLGESYAIAKNYDNERAAATQPQPQAQEAAAPIDYTKMPPLAENEAAPSVRKFLAKVTQRTGVETKLLHMGKASSVNTVYKDGVMYFNGDKLADVNKFVLAKTAHELVHAKGMDNLYSMAVDYYRIQKEGKNERVDPHFEEELIANKQAEYAQDGIQLSNQEAQMELAAQFMEEVLSQSGRAEELLTRDRSTFQRVFDYIKERLAEHKAVKNMSYQDKQEYLLLQRAEREFERALNRQNVKDGKARYSFAGVQSETGDISLLEKAKQAERTGISKEQILKDTGWFRGADGKWRFEISDKDMELVDKPKLEYHEDYQTANLADVLKHDSLFQAYPDLRDYTIVIQETEPGVRGSYFAGDKQIVLSRELFKRYTQQYKDYLNGGRAEEIAMIEATPAYKEYSKFHDDEIYSEMDPVEWLKLEEEARNKFFSSEIGKRYYELMWGDAPTDITKFEAGWTDEARSVLMHEIQHAIQGIEGFASGANERYWQRRLDNKTVPLDAGKTASDLYTNTAGEIEARDTAGRLNLTDEERRINFPESAKENPDRVFAEGAGTSDSIIAQVTDDNGNTYKNVVLLDTTFFDGISPRNWGKKLQQYIHNRASKSTFILPITDENGKTQMLEFAKPNDTIINGKGDRRVVLNKLSQTNENLSKLSILHIDEIVSVSDKNTPYYTVGNNKYQWLDKHGWLHRNAVVGNIKNNNLYRLIFDIAKTSDGRLILYATNGKINNLGRVSSGLNSLHQNEKRSWTVNQDYNGSVPHTEEFVKPLFSKSEENPEITQLKSATANVGTFDEDNGTPDYSLGNSTIYDQYRAAETRAEERTRREQAEYEEVQQAVRDKDAQQRAANAAVAKNLLTDFDNLQVDRLLKGEITPDEISSKANNREGILAVYEAKKALQETQDKISRYRANRKQETIDKPLEAIVYDPAFDDVKDKNSKLVGYDTQTMERNIRDVFKNANLAQRINDTIFRPVHKAEGQRQKFLREQKAKISALKLNQMESAYTQRLGELNMEIDDLSHRKRLSQNAKDRLQDLQKQKAKVLEQARKDHINLDKVEGAIDVFHKVYEELLPLINEALIKNGYDPVPHRKYYFPHFQENGEPDGLFQKMLSLYGADLSGIDLPTSISGKTKDFRPGKQWAGNLLQRLGSQTSFDAVKGFEHYIESVSGVIYHTENIRRLREFERQIRYKYSQEGVQEEIEKAKNDNTVPEEYKNARLQDLYNRNLSALPNFVQELTDYTNQLANKKSAGDRESETNFGRKGFYSLMNTLNNAVAAARVGWNISTQFKNFIPFFTASDINPKYFVQGIGALHAAKVRDDGFVDESAFLSARRASPTLSANRYQRASDAFSSFVDNFTTEAVTRARYYQNIDQGMSHAAAMDEADTYVAGVVGDRSRGGKPLIFNQKSPLVRMVTAFQLEPTNDLMRERDIIKTLGKKREFGELAAHLVRYAITTWLGNQLLKWLTGSDATFSAIDIAQDTYRIVTSDDSLGVKLSSLWEAVASEVPMAGNFASGGRSPLDFKEDLLNLKPLLDDTVGYATGEIAGDKLKNSAYKGFSPLLYNFVPGGSQIKKTTEGVRAVHDGGSFAVNDEGEKELQFAIDNKNPLTYAKAATFGKYSLPRAQEYVDSGFQRLSAPQTKTFQESGLDYDTFMEYVDFTKSAKSDKKNGQPIDGSKKAKIADQILKMDITDEQKSVLLKAQNVKTKVDVLNTMDADTRYGYFTLSGEKQKEADGYYKKGLSYKNYIAYDKATKNIKGDKTVDGKDITNSATAKKAAAIRQLNLPDDELMIVLNDMSENTKYLELLEAAPKDILDFYEKNVTLPKGKSREKAEALCNSVSQNEAQYIMYMKLCGYGTSKADQARARAVLPQALSGLSEKDRNMILEKVLKED